MPELVPLPSSTPYVEHYSRGVLRATRYSYDHLLRYHLASMVVLAEQGLISREHARKIVAALFELRSLGVDRIPLDPALENIHPNVERAVIERVGAEIGGQLALGRARAELGYVAEYLALREETLDAMDRLVRLDGVLRAVAGRTLDALAPYYTSHMRGEPITFGYYFAAVNEGVQQHHRRLREAYARMDNSPAGLGHLVPMPVGLDRPRLAKLLGFSTQVQTSLYGYINVDVPIDLLGTVALIAGGLGRFALDLYFWAGSDIALIRFGDAFVGSSFVMPQKRNPSFLKPVHRAAIEAKTLHGKALEMFGHTPPMRMVITEQIPSQAHEALDEFRAALTLLADGVASLTVDRARGKLLAEADFTQAAQLVHLLVAQHGVSWRGAEQIIGQLVRTALAEGRTAAQIDLAAVAAAAKEVTGKEIAVDPAAWRAALDADAIVRSRGDSGPAPEAVERVLAAQEAIANATAAHVSGQRRRLDEVWRGVDAAARGI